MANPSIERVARKRAPAKAPSRRTRARPAGKRASPGRRIPRILVIDIGGTHVKILVSGESEPRKLDSGKGLSPEKMISEVKALAKGWSFDAVSIGFPGIVGRTGPACEPGNLGKGWVGYDFAAAFERPVKVANDAAMQALGSYEGGRMLFLGLGTGLGAAFIAEQTIIPFELGELPWRRDSETLGQALSTRGLEKSGGRAWRETVELAATRLMKAFLVDYVMIGGGNAKRLNEPLPHGLRLGHNRTAFRGGFRLWDVEDVPVLSTGMLKEPRQTIEWRLL
jgi:polyphosphate glucokinase